jgi:hypothetical protein
MPGVARSCGCWGSAVSVRQAPIQGGAARRTLVVVVDRAGGDWGGGEGGGAGGGGGGGGRAECVPGPGGECGGELEVAQVPGGAREEGVALGGEEACSPSVGSGAFVCGIVEAVRVAEGPAVEVGMGPLPPCPQGFPLGCCLGSRLCGVAPAEGKWKWKGGPQLVADIIHYGSLCFESVIPILLGCPAICYFTMKISQFFFQPDKE